MAKRVRGVSLADVLLDAHAAMPLYRQLYERLRAEILAGQLEAGTRLPSTRALASHLGVSRNTTAFAYQQLLLEGYLVGRVGDGTRVAQLRPDQRAPGGDTTGETTAASAERALLSRRGQALLEAPYPGERYGNGPAAGSWVFRIGTPDMRHFPQQTWARLIARHAHYTMSGGPRTQQAHGYPPVREAIAAHIGITRGVHCSPDQIIMTSGSQGALDLVARVLLDPGDHVWVEEPGYPGARGALLSAGARLVPVPVDDEGIVVGVGRRHCVDARLAVVTPSHQFPTASTMSLGRRLELLRWADEAHAWIAEDDYDSEYRFSGRPLEALQGLDSQHRVIYIGTFSKILSPELRLGYLVAPAALVPGFLAARRFTDVSLPPLEQMALADFLAEGHFARHLRRMRLLYHERRDALVGALRQELGDVLTVTAPEAGMHLVAWLPAGMNARDIARRGATHGLSLVPVAAGEPEASAASMRSGLALGFAADTPDALRAGVLALAEVIQTEKQP